MRLVYLLVTRSFVACSVAAVSLAVGPSCSAASQDTDLSQCNECIPIATDFLETIFNEAPAAAKVQKAYYNNDMCAVACEICIKSYKIVIAGGVVIKFFDSSWSELREGEDSAKIETPDEAFARSKPVLLYYDLPNSPGDYRVQAQPIDRGQNWWIARKLVWNNLPVRDKELDIELNGESGRVIAVYYEKKFKPPVNIGNEISQQEATDRAVRWFEKTYPGEVPGGLQSVAVQSVTKVVAPYGRLPKRLREQSLMGKYFLCWEVSFVFVDMPIINIVVRIDNGDIVGINSDRYNN